MAPRTGSGGTCTPHNKRMHATRDTLLVINLNGVGGRVMRGVMPPERGSVMAQQARAASLRRA
jgi:hypothetical protein